jgi:predicted phage terminase large subunit-like protein
MQTDPGVIGPHFQSRTAPPLLHYEVGPQDGSQTLFLSTDADIVVYGGAAGAGKTFGLLMGAYQGAMIPGFGAVIFRRTYPQIMNPGGLWDTAMELYRPAGGVPKETASEWRFPSGAKIRFAHMQHEDDRYQWDGAQVPFIGFDQLEHFSWKMFSYMMSRNRTTCGYRPVMRATCNPDPDHWLRTFMAWWINDDIGVPIPERSGVVRWFLLRDDDEVHWASTREALLTEFGADVLPTSFTFVAGTVYDNKALLLKNPEYLTRLQSLSMVDRERLLGGNWNIREAAGMFYRREWFEIVRAAPMLDDCVRYWDRAATAEEVARKRKNASWTAGVRMGVDARGIYYITDVARFQGTPLDVRQAVRNIALQDTTRVRVGIEQDPGQAGKAEAEDHVRNLAGFDASINAVREAKGTRTKPLSAQVEAGNVKLVAGAWNEAFLRETQNFDGTDNCVSDQVDAASGAFYLLTSSKQAGTWGT